MFAYVNEECKRLGMTLWAYDQVGYGHYGWLEKAAAEMQGPAARSEFTSYQADGHGSAADHYGIAGGQVARARAYPLETGVADDSHSIDLADGRRGRRSSQWTPPAGTGAWPSWWPCPISRSI